MESSLSMAIKIQALQLLDQAVKERRSATGRIRRGDLGQPSKFEPDGWEAVFPWRFFIEPEIHLRLASRQRPLRNVSPIQIMDAARFLAARRSRGIARCFSYAGQCRCRT